VTRRLLALKDLADVEEIHTVTRESATLLKVRTRETQTLAGLPERIHSTEGIGGTRSYNALSTYLERDPSPTEVCAPRSNDESPPPGGGLLHVGCCGER